MVFYQVTFGRHGEKRSCKILSYQETSIPYMNSKHRKSMHKRNMLRNKYKKKRDWWSGMYTGCKGISQHPFIRNLYKKATYFSEGCDGGA